MTVLPTLKYRVKNVHTLKQLSMPEKYDEQYVKSNESPNNKKLDHQHAIFKTNC